MDVERVVGPDDVVRDRQVLPDHKRAATLGRVVSLDPPIVAFARGGRSRLVGRSVDNSGVSLSLSVGDHVLCTRVAQGLVAVTRIEVF